MPSLKDALQKPANVGDPIEVAAPAIAQRPPAPPYVPNPQGGLATGSMGPAPASFTTPYDSVRQFIRPGVSQSRFPPLPTKANPQLNATTRSIASKVIASSSGSIELIAPSIFTRTDQTVDLPGPLVLDLADELPSTVFAGPVATGGVFFIDTTDIFSGENSAPSGPPNGPITHTWSTAPTQTPEFAVLVFETEGGNSLSGNAPAGWPNTGASAPYANNAGYMGVNQTSGFSESVTVTQSFALGMSGVLITCLQNGTAAAVQGAYSAGGFNFSSTAGSVSATFSLNVTSGNAIFVGIIGGGKAIEPTTFNNNLPSWIITDTAGNVYQNIAIESTDGPPSEDHRTYTGLWVCSSAVGGSSFTITATTPTCWLAGTIVIMEVSGLLQAVGAKPTFRKLVGTDLPIFEASGLLHSIGAVPDPGATAGITRFLREDSTWQIPFASGGGTANVTSDTHPASPNAMDDEFETASINLGLWTEVNSPTVSLASGSLILATASTGVFNVSNIQQTIPIAPWKFGCKIILNSWGATVFQYQGLVVGDGTKFWIWGPAGESGSYYSYWGRYTNNATRNSFSRSDIVATGYLLSVPEYYAIWNDSTNVHFQVSADGINWLDIYTIAVADFEASGPTAWTPTIVGLGQDTATSIAGTVQPTSFDWFRRLI